MKLDFDIKIKGLDGAEQDQKLGELLAVLLAQATKGDATKMIPWGIKLMAGQELDLDKADQKVLRKFIDDNESLTLLGKFRLTEIMDEFELKQKEDAKK
jgi:hypothetical protein